MQQLRFDGPDRLVSNDDLAPVLNMLSDSSQLAGVDLGGASCFTLIEFLSNAGHHAHVVSQGVLHFESNDLVGFSEHVATLAVSEDDPVKAKVFEHLGRVLTSVSSVSVLGAVLGGKLHNRLGAESGGNMADMDAAGGHYNFDFLGVELEGVQDGFGEDLAKAAVPC